MTRNKLYSILLSVVVAFGLWLYVVNNVSPEDDATFYNIPVVLEGEAVLNERNLMITGISAKTASVNVSGTRSDLSKLNSSNVTVKVDLSQIDEPGDKIPLTTKVSNSADVATNAITVESRNPITIYVDVDTRRKKEVPVVVHWTGTRSSDHIYDTENVVLDYPTITVAGPAEVADRIDHALIEVDLTQQVESLSESYRYTLCDYNGEPVDAEQITTSVEEVRLDLKVQRIKEVKLVANVVYGGGATELNTLVTVEPETVRLSGSEAILEELGDTLTLATLNLAEVEQSQGFKYAITLPEGVTNQTGVSEAVVTVRFSGLSTRSFTVDDIQIINVPDGMEAEIINSSLEVKVRGPATEISLLTAEDITAVVDFASALEGNSTYKVTFTYGEQFPNVGALKTYSVPATVRAVEE